LKELQLILTFYKKSIKKELPSRQSLLIWLKEKADQKVCCNVIYIRHMPDPT